MAESGIIIQLEFQEGDWLVLSTEDTVSYGLIYGCRRV